jgi:hypothetical protein
VAPQDSASGAAIYQIRVRGKLSARWSDWLGGMTIFVEETDQDAPEAVLSGPVVDQPALRGILNRLWGLNLTIISVSRDAALSEIV